MNYSKLLNLGAYFQLHSTESNFEVQSREPTPLDSPYPQDSPLEHASTSVCTEEVSNSDSHDDQRKRKKHLDDSVDEQQQKKLRKGHGSHDIIDK